MIFNKLLTSTVDISLVWYGLFFFGNFPESKDIFKVLKKKSNLLELLVQVYFVMVERIRSIKKGQPTCNNLSLERP